MKFHAFLFVSAIALGFASNLTAAACTDGDYNVSSTFECIYGKKDDKCDHGDKVNPSKTYPTLCFYCEDGFEFNDKDKKCEKKIEIVPQAKK